MPAYVMVNLGTSVTNVSDISNVRPEDIVGVGYNGPDRCYIEFYTKGLFDESVNKKSEQKSKKSKKS